MDLGSNLWMNVAHDLRMWEFKRDESTKGHQYALAMNMLRNEDHDWMFRPYSQKSAKEKRNFLLSKTLGLVAHDRCINWHYIPGAEHFSKL